MEAAPLHEEVKASPPDAMPDRPYCYFVRFTLAAALALITPALFSHRTPPDREKRETDPGGRGFFLPPGGG
jgi:hypothetical protein